MAEFTYSDLVGKRFAFGGRGPDMFDCWGLVRAVLLRQGLRDVPEYPSSPLNAENGRTISGARADWVRLERAVPGCVVLFRDEFGIGSHVGVVLDGERFLHTTQLLGGAVIAELGDPRWCGLIVGFYAWRPQVKA